MIDSGTRLAELASQFTLQTFPYASQEQALGVYCSLSGQTKLQMGKVYQDAFGGPPWYEQYQCRQCGAYLPTPGACIRCSSNEVSEAYPIDELIKNYFPKMLTDFTPGGLILTRNGLGEVVGWSTGGGVRLNNLGRIKYKGNPQILNSIISRCNIDPNKPVFYDNETCVPQSLQKLGVGRGMSQERVNLAVQLGFENICGRTINMPWLRLKKQQLETAGYEFSSFIPDGEDYAVDGVKRQFYLAKKIIN